MAITNEYSESIRPEFFQDVPKSIWAAIAISYLLHDRGARWDEVEDLVLHEWDVLHRNGIIPQKARAGGKSPRMDPDEL